MPLILMRILEGKGLSFDRWMRILTCGRLEHACADILAAINPHDRVLEVGCGTGRLALELAARGASVMAIDISDKMIGAARENLAAAEPGRVELRRLSALEIDDHFPEQHFDRVVSVLTFSELSEAEVDCVLRQCRRVLRDSGQLLLVDEAVPQDVLRRIFFAMLRYPARLLVFLLSQSTDLGSANPLKAVLYYVIELPLMLLTFLVVPPASRPLQNLEGRVQQAGFRTASSKEYLGGLLRLWRSEGCV